MLHAFVAATLSLATCLSLPGISTAAGPDLKRDGAFGFPQKQATIVCDTPELRVSVWNNSEHLYVQAVMFADGDDALGETEDGRPLGDTSTLAIDVDADGKPTPQVDRQYSLNPWPSLPGLNYQIVMSATGSSGLASDSKGRGAISYVEVDPGHRVRVDSFLIPLAEIKREPGDEIRVAYWGHSPKPVLTLNSIGFKSDKPYYAHSLPWKDYSKVVLSDRADAFDETQVPEGRKLIAVEKKPAKPMPKTGESAPEVSAIAWINWKTDAPPSLTSLRGKVVVVEFWATWCGPCVAGIPHLNQIHDTYSGKGLVILSLTDQRNKEYIEAFMKKTPMAYTVGVGSQSRGEYGVQSIPHAFVINRAGKVAWAGYPLDDGFEKAIKAALP